MTIPNKSWRQKSQLLQIPSIINKPKYLNSNTFVVYMSFLVILWLVMDVCVSYFMGVLFFVYMIVVSNFA